MDNDFKIPMKSKTKSYEVEHDSLSQQAVEKLMARDVDHICGIFGVDVSISYFRSIKILIFSNRQIQQTYFCGIKNGTRRSLSRITWTTPPKFLLTPAYLQLKQVHNLQHLSDPRLQAASPQVNVPHVAQSF